MFLKFRIKRLLSKYFSEEDNDISRHCYWQIVLIMSNKSLFKKHINFIYMICDYKKRKGICTQVQLDALERLNNG